MSENNQFIFNVLDWHEFDEVDDDEDDIDVEIDDEDEISVNPVSKTKKKQQNVKKYVIKAFGRNEDGESVYLKIKKFPPHFYVLVPDLFEKNPESLFNKIKSHLPDSMKNDIKEHDIVKRKKLYGFCANKKFHFLRLVFDCKYKMINVSRTLNNKLRIDNKNIKLELYESNIDPFIRFMHIQNLTSCGWIQIDKSKLKINYEKTTCDHSFSVDWDNVLPIEIVKLAPFKVCSFDLECYSGDGSFPQASRIDDKIIQIGMTFNNYGSSQINKKIMISLGTCDVIPNTRVIIASSETDLLLKFKDVIQKEDPDVITGYNIFQFDLPYLVGRAELLKVPQSFYNLSKLMDYKCKLICKDLCSSGLGDNKLKYLDMIGRVSIDLMKIVQRDYKLSVYKLDTVAENFFKDEVKTIIPLEDNKFKVESKNIHILKINNFVRFEKDGEVIMEKYKIINISYDEGYFIVENLDEELIGNYKIFWGMVKDDIKPNDIFRLYNETSRDRKMIAEYCIQDCALVSNLMIKLEILTNNISMASVCHVPLHYIILRGQGVKCLSLVAKFCRREGYLIPVMKVQEESTENVGYEGATVFEPETGFHRKPIPVLDFNSLYPSSIISKNVSHETLVVSPEYDNLPNYTYYDVNYNSHDGSVIHCRYAKKNDEFMTTNPAKSKFGIIPTILMGLLSERKLTKKEMDKETDPFKKNILDGKQLALKVTANSVYGQLGAPTSPIYFKHGAASTTAIGRDMLCLSRDFVENHLTNILKSLYDAYINDDNELLESLMKKYLKERDAKFEQELMPFLNDLFTHFKFKPRVVYGDTDSIFINMDFKDINTDEDLYDRNTLRYNIELGKITSRFLKTLLPYPHNMEYEKTFHPFALMSKKKYIGNKFEDNVNKYKRISMGDVLKRRDNAKIVKRVIGGMVNIMMEEIDLDKAIRFVTKAITDMLQGKFGIHEFVTSKTLKGNYKDRTRLAHVVLADRMALRDPGNAPELNDRIPYVAIQVKDTKNKMLQGDKVEHPDFIIQNNLKIDYLFYLTNQIMNPAIQFLELQMKPAEAEKIFTNFIVEEELKRKKRKDNQVLKIMGATNSKNQNHIDDNFEFGNKFNVDNLINNNAKPNNNVKSKKII